jgi:ATP-binding cassette, subfamily B, beta-glucan exporter
MTLSRIYLRVLGRLRPDRRVAGVLVGANVALAVAAFAEPILFGRIIDSLSRADAGDAGLLASIAPLLIAWVGFGLFTIVAGVLIALHADKLAHRRRLAVMADYFEHVIQLPVAFHTRTHSGRVLKVMLEGSSSMFMLWLGFFRDHLSALVALGVLLPLTLFLNWRLGLLLVILVAVFTAMTAFVLRRTEKLQGKVERHHSHLAEFTSDSLGNVPVVQSFTRIDAEARAIRAIMSELLRAQTPVLSWWALASVATRASATLTVTSIVLFGAYLFTRGQASIGEIVTFMSLATMLVGRLEQVVHFVNGLFMQAPKLAEFFAVLDTAPSVRDEPDARDVGRFAGGVACEDVSFAYDGINQAIADVSFTVTPGETIAIVGATGSGKSTTVSLLYRAFDPTHGTVRIDGHDIRTLTLASLRRNIGVVFQEPMLFARTIRENLLVGRPDATDEELVAAMERAQAGAFLRRQPAGLDTMLGERGRSLSGGERQRLSIARALLKDPPILILDEATSALDSRTESRVQAAMEEVRRGRTTFVIAHRLATIRNADRIIVFEDGRIVETGSHAELVARGGRFASFARTQFVSGAAAE